MRAHSRIARMLLLPIIAFGYTACASVESPQEQAQPAAVVTTPAAAAVVTVPSELVTLHPGFVTAWQGTDPAALRVYFADDAMVMTPAGHFMGWTDINTKWIAPALPNMSKYVLTPTAFTKDGNVIVERGNLAYVLTKDGQPQNITGTYTHRWQLQSDGTWRLVSIQIK
jgi:ketosteroid isomerase-like protein